MMQPRRFTIRFARIAWVRNDAKSQAVSSASFTGDFMFNRKLQIVNRKWILIVGACLCSSVFADEAQPSKDILRRFSSIDTILEKAVRDASQTRMSDPLRFISKDMKSVVGDLAGFHTDQPVQVKEQKVVAQLDEVIKLLEQQCKKGKAGGSLNPSNPMPDSKLGGGPGGIHDLVDPKASEKIWGQLSPKQREQILQSKTDGFPAGYESLLQSYYKRLAAEKVTEEPAPGTDKTPSNAKAPAPTDK